MLTPRIGSALAALLASPALLAQSNPFGPNVLILDPSTPSATLQDQLTAISKEDQFSRHRQAVLFKPGAYNIQAPVGYYEQIAGLGFLPGGVTINGFLTPNFGVPVYNTPTWPQANLTDTFWRSLENMTINPATDTLQNAPPNTLQWGVSQAAALRRLQINGGLELTNSYCGNASGGFMSDLLVTGKVSSCSQQQWYTRNSTLGSWDGGVWNMVFSGVDGAPAPSYPKPPETVLATTPVSREKPFLYIDSAGNYSVFAPFAQRNTHGTTWAAGQPKGRSLPLFTFFIAQPTNTAQQINAALAQGKNLILTPGVYNLDRALEIKRPDTVVLGLGYATLIPQNGTAAITVSRFGFGAQIAGLILDAGPKNSPVLFQVGAPKGENFSLPFDPTTLSDINLRVGGAELGRATTSLEIDQDNVLLDNIWAWRADHGTAADGSDVGWTVNTADHGLVVNADNVTALGLAVEHYQKSEVVWNGNGGETIFFQNELPYDVPNQAAWMNGTANGYPAYEVAAGVKTHQAYGLGMYSFFNKGIDIVEDNAVTVPNTPGVVIHDAGTVWLNGSGQITHVINGLGAAVNSGYADQLSGVVVYP